MPVERFTSMQAARLSGVPFFTVDSWDRTRFLQPSVTRAGGRGRGRERFYSYEDVLRLRIARELRDQHVSLQTLRHVVSKLARQNRGLRTARYVLVGRRVQLARSFDELVACLRRARWVFGFLLDLTDVARAIGERARHLRAAVAAAHLASPGSGRPRSAKRVQ